MSPVSWHLQIPQYFQVVFNLIFVQVCTINVLTFININYLLLILRKSSPERPRSETMRSSRSTFLKSVHSLSTFFLFSLLLSNLWFLQFFNSWVCFEGSCDCFGLLLAAALIESLHSGLGLVTLSFSFGLKGVTQRAKNRGVQLIVRKVACRKQKGNLSPYQVVIYLECPLFF